VNPRDAFALGFGWGLLAGATIVLLVTIMLSAVH